MASARFPARVRTTAGYVWSLRPYRWSAVTQRTLRQGMRRIRHLPGGRLITPERRNGHAAAMVASECPIVDATWARSRLEAAGARVEHFTLDPAAFQTFLQQADFPDWYSGGPSSPAFREKTLEHYVGAQLLEIASGDVYMDVGADNSPFAPIAEQLYGCAGYRLDAAYRRAVHGRYIGSDVRSIPLPDRSVDKMAAHCAFDHFQGDADEAFLREAGRLLRPGGRLCILPLYLDVVTTNYIDSSTWARPAVLDPDARVIEVPGWGYEFSRFYAPERLVELAAKQSDCLSLRVFEIHGTEEAGPGCYLRMAALFERKQAA
jgi:SAM-dependent methyltransferase